MKETGVIRRIDELGRIVIPKEIRKRLRVGPGDMLDIYTSDKQIVLSKYTELNEIDEHLLYLLKAFKNNHLDLIVTSSSDVIASTTNRISKHDVITEEFLNLFLKSEFFQILTVPETVCYRSPVFKYNLSFIPLF